LYFSSGVKLHETIRLSDVEAFRKSSFFELLFNYFKSKNSTLQVLQTRARPMIYRYIDSIKNSFALLETIHFELFMPDRPDLRFLAVPVATVSGGVAEGDFFRVPDADLLSNPSFAAKLGKTKYPVVWEAKRIEKIEFGAHLEETGLSYIVKRNARAGGEFAINELFDRDFFIRETLFPDEDSRREHSLVRVTMKNLFTAHIYPVEPP
ncbi:hypothetical protein PMAYCL1PPCAC_19588, partial [Pristionchus mayeri]